jgi:hypothetical protein
MLGIILFDPWLTWTAPRFLWRRLELGLVRHASLSFMSSTSAPLFSRDYSVMYDWKTYWRWSDWIVKVVCARSDTSVSIAGNIDCPHGVEIGFKKQKVD